MATGYTAQVQKGEATFADFVLSCARAFGACIMQRDDPSDEKPQLQEPGDYHSKALEQLATKKSELLAMSDEEADRLSEKEFFAIIDRRNEREKETAATRANYEKMLAEVNAWEPPTTDHQGLKDFMTQQLTDSINWDCSNVHGEALPARLKGPDWKQKALLQVEHDIEYHTTAYAEEVARTNSRNEWITALYQSLQPVAQA